MYIYRYTLQGIYEDNTSAILHSIQSNNNDSNNKYNTNKSFAFGFYISKFAILFVFIYSFQRGMPINACVINFYITR